MEHITFDDILSFIYYNADREKYLFIKDLYINICHFNQRLSKPLTFNIVKCLNPKRYSIQSDRDLISIWTYADRVRITYRDIVSLRAMEFLLKQLSIKLDMLPYHIHISINYPS